MNESYWKKKGYEPPTDPSEFVEETEEQIRADADAWVADMESKRQLPKDE